MLGASQGTPRQPPPSQGTPRHAPLHKLVRGPERGRHRPRAGPAAACCSGGAARRRGRRRRREGRACTEGERNHATKRNAHCGAGAPWRGRRRGEQRCRGASGLPQRRRSWLAKDPTAEPSQERACGRRSSVPAPAAAGGQEARVTAGRRRQQGAGRRARPHTAGKNHATERPHCRHVVGGGQGSGSDDQVGS